MEKIIFFLPVGGMEYKDGGQNVSDSWQRSHTLESSDRFCHVSFVSTNTVWPAHSLFCVQKVLLCDTGPETPLEQYRDFKIYLRLLQYLSDVKVEMFPE